MLIMEQFYKYVRNIIFMVGKHDILGTKLHTYTRPAQYCFGYVFDQESNILSQGHKVTRPKGHKVTMAGCYD